MRAYTMHKDREYAGSGGPSPDKGESKLTHKRDRSSVRQDGKREIKAQILDSMPEVDFSEIMADFSYACDFDCEPFCGQENDDQEDYDLTPEAMAEIEQITQHIVSYVDYFRT